jgi:uncharacterized membrane-anchored protein
MESDLSATFPKTIDPTFDKVAPVTLYFWVVKIIATTVGEAVAEYADISRHLGLAKAAMLMLSLMLVALLAQLRADRFRPVIYWTLFMFISMVGTLIGDNLSVCLNGSVRLAVLVLAGALAATLLAWRAGDGILPVQGITTAWHERYYWLAMLVSFALGTAFGELLVESSWLAPLRSALVLGTAIALVALCHRLSWLRTVPAFWLAFVITGPFGAVLGELASEPKAAGGLGLGNLSTTAILLTAFLCLVAYTAIARRFAVESSSRRP